MSEITVAKAGELPDEWLLEIVHARRIDGMLDFWATYVSGDVPLDDHLPPDRRIAHPWRSMMRMRELAREKSLVTCECCRRRGELVGAGQEARVRCVAHVDGA